MKKSARDTIGVAMMYSNYDKITSQTVNSNVINMQGEYTLAMAEKALTRQITQMKPTYENDEGKSLFADPDNHDFAYGLYWSCDAGLVMADNENLRYFVPDWTNFWIDNFVLPVNGTQSEETTNAAYAFINFMLEKNNAVKNMNYVGAASAIKLTSAEKEEIDDGTIFPSSTVLANGAVMRNFETDEIEANVNALMIDIISKAASLDEKGNLNWLWITLAVIGACGLGYLAYWLLNRRRLRSA
jgi:hypothetical protein